MGDILSEWRQQSERAGVTDSSVQMIEIKIQLLPFGERKNNFPRIMSMHLFAIF